MVISQPPKKLIKNIKNILSKEKKSTWHKHIFLSVLLDEFLVALSGILCLSPTGVPGISFPRGPSAPAGPLGGFSPPQLGEAAP